MKTPRILILMVILTLAAGISWAEPIAIGGKAPAVAGMTDSGDILDLGKVYAENAYTLVWFYPRALTGGCTRQGCSLRDASTELKQFGVAVVGVSVDPVEKQKEFKEVNNFPFPLIADTEKVVMRAFGQTGAGSASREAYLIDRTGTVIYYDKGQTDQQADLVLAFLKSVKK